VGDVVELLLCVNGPNANSFPFINQPPLLWCCAIHSESQLSMYCCPLLYFKERRSVVKERGKERERELWKRLGESLRHFLLLFNVEDNRKVTQKEKNEFKKLRRRRRRKKRVFVCVREE